VLTARSKAPSLTADGVLAKAPRRASKGLIATQDFEVRLFGITMIFTCGLWVSRETTPGSRVRMQQAEYILYYLKRSWRPFQCAPVRAGCQLTQGFGVVVPPTGGPHVRVVPGG
jgi:hypothetical protein